MIKVILNPDKEVVREISAALKASGGYCPCRISKTEDTKCKCKAFREQIEREEEGLCHCGLYKIIKTENEE